MNKTRQKIHKKSGYAILNSVIGNLGRINIVYSGNPEGKNYYDYIKYKELFKNPQH